MTTKEIEKLGQMLIEIGTRLKQDPQLMKQLEEFLQIVRQKDEKSVFVDLDKVNRIDLFQLAREKNSEELANILSSFNLKELREILKKYRFGSPSKLKTGSQIINYILNQLNQRKIDVFTKKDSPQ
jgi:hypothetical protein